jgi:hypothetical protein
MATAATTTTATTTLTTLDRIPILLVAAADYGIVRVVEQHLFRVRELTWIPLGGLDPVPVPLTLPVRSRGDQRSILWSRWRER